MKIGSISLLAFKSRIIDAHTHTGHWDRPDHSRYTIYDIFERAPENDTLEKIIVSNLDCMKKGDKGKPILDEIKGNELLLMESQGDDRVVPLATCAPKTGSVQNIKNLFKNHPNKFYGLKFHPDCHEILASDKRFDPYLEFAHDNNLPCVFHSGINYKGNSGELVDEAYRYSSPNEIYALAKRHPDVPIVMAHMGAGGERVHRIALKALIDSIEKGDANLYADMSWVDIHTINGEKPNLVQAIKLLKHTSKGDKTDRLLFGTDAPIGEYRTEYGLYQSYVDEIKKAIKEDKELAPEADEILDNLFYNNAKKLFKI